MGRRVNTRFLPFLAASVLAVTLAASPAAAQREDGAGPLPSLEQIVEKVRADESQAKVLGDAYEELVAARPGPRVQRDGRPGAGRGQRSASPVRPMREFLMASAATLDADQMVALIGLVEEGRDEWREEGRGRRGGKGGPDARGEGRGRGQGRGQGQSQGFGARHEPLYEQLELTEEQKQKIEKAYGETRESLSELRDDQRERAQKEREELNEEMQKILGDEKWNQLLDLRNERRLGNAQEADARFEERLGEQMEFLTAVLHLSESQQSELKAKLTEQHQQRALMRRSQNWAEGGPKVGGGGPSFEERAEQRAQMRAEVLEILNDEQKPVFEALGELAFSGGPQGHGRFDGRGRGPRDGGGPRGRRG